MKASDHIAARLASLGVRDIFAISGAGNVNLLDAIARHPVLRYYCPHHEQAGVMAAIAYSRLSPHPGMMLTTGGPGAANAITGVLDAWADSIPCLVISGQEKAIHTRSPRGLRMWGVQGFDIIGAVKGITKYAALVDDPASIDLHLGRAIHLATTGRPGPVWLDVPMDVQSATIDPESLVPFVPESGGPPAPDLDTIVARLRAARRPVLLLGNGIRLAGAADLVPRLLDRVPVPVITSWNGADLLATDHPLCFGHAGVYGQRCANFVIQNCDFLLSVGSRLAIPQVGYHAADYARRAYRVMVDIDPAELAKFAGVFEQLVAADAGRFLAALLDGLPAPTPRPDAWLTQCGEWRTRYPLVDPSMHEQPPGGPVNSYHFIDRLSAHLGPDDVVVTDMGAALTSTHQAIRLKPGQRLVTSTGLGEMGFGLPGAIGAAVACPGKRIILIVGDGSLMMNLQELQTLVHHRLPVKLFLYCNDAYLTIKHTQTALFEGRLAGSGADSGVSCPDFVAVAGAFGIRTTRLANWSGVDTAIHATLAGREPALCEIAMDPMQPLVPKLSFSQRADGTLFSPPLEDLAPALPREQLAREMSASAPPIPSPAP